MLRVTEPRWKAGTFITRRTTLHCSIERSSSKLKSVGMQREEGTGLPSCSIVRKVVLRNSCLPQLPLARVGFPEPGHQGMGGTSWLRIALPAAFAFSPPAHPHPLLVSTRNHRKRYCTPARCLFCFIFQRVFLCWWEGPQVTYTSHSNVMLCFTIFSPKSLFQLFLSSHTESLAPGFRLAQLWSLHPLEE